MMVDRTDCQFGEVEGRILHIPRTDVNYQITERYKSNIQNIAVVSIFSDIMSIVLISKDLIFKTNNNTPFYVRFCIQVPGSY